MVDLADELAFICQHSYHVSIMILTTYCLLNFTSLYSSLYEVTIREDFGYEYDGRARFIRTSKS